ncbi:hydrophobin-315 [Coprinopsis cinerea okayama7|uniref:Class I hydrophobin 1 n=1 Tax=Coprinopsis cinerea (strain Okayama-7 / 130 / ATCC MYA-4618 / FGSC 9003) TaxID=240176 RepID=HYD1_COPC7|nr:hydrophobin-315 [Coprinopsis cinerea okayama7\|eukprot:XP_001839855.1 hydrophobin-315 [Coprinopsis cinerea okayama7\
MFARLSTALLAFTLATAVVAAPGGRPSEVEYEQCNGGEIQCCNSYQKADSLDYNTSKLLGLLNIDVKQITAGVGLTCTGINAVGIGGGSSCTQQKVCCTNNKFNGVVALGCSPINVSL